MHLSHNSGIRRESSERLAGHAAGSQLGHASSATLPATNNDMETIVPFALNYISASHDTIPMNAIHR